MSILIKGMEMPKDGAYWCEIGVAGEIATITIHGEDRKSFRLIPIPPHGRLIDADVLMLMIQEYIDEYGWDVDEHGFHSEKWCAMKETEMAINDAPTVIPADKEEVKE